MPWQLQCWEPSSESCWLDSFSLTAFQDWSHQWSIDPKILSWKCWRPVPTLWGMKKIHPISVWICQMWSLELWACASMSLTIALAIAFLVKCLLKKMKLFGFGAQRVKLGSMPSTHSVPSLTFPCMAWKQRPSACSSDVPGWCHGTPYFTGNWFTRWGYSVPSCAVWLEKAKNLTVCQTR